MDPPGAEVSASVAAPTAQGTLQSRRISALPPAMPNDALSAHRQGESRPFDAGRARRVSSRAGRPPLLIWITSPTLLLKCFSWKHARVAFAIRCRVSRSAAAIRSLCASLAAGWLGASSGTRIPLNPRVFIAPSSYGAAGSKRLTSRFRITRYCVEPDAATAPYNVAFPPKQQATRTRLNSVYPPTAISSTRG